MRDARMRDGDARGCYALSRGAESVCFDDMLMLMPHTATILMSLTPILMLPAACYATRNCAREKILYDVHAASPFAKMPSFAAAIGSSAFYRCLCIACRAAASATLDAAAGLLLRMLRHFFTCHVYHTEYTPPRHVCIRQRALPFFHYLRDTHYRHTRCRLRHAAFLLRHAARYAADYAARLRFIAGCQPPPRHADA